MQMRKRASELLGESYDVTRHASGLPIYVFPKDCATTHAIFAARFGSLDRCYREPGSREWVTLPDGTAHFLEHKLFDNPDGSDSFARFSELGADANAYTDYGHTAYLFSCTEHFDEALAELLRFVTTPYFTPESIRKEQGIIAEEIRMYRDNPWDRAFQNLMEGMYRENPVRRNICGSEESIAQITDRLLYDCCRTFYRLPEMVLVVCGRVTPEQVLRVADAVLPRGDTAGIGERQAAAADSASPLRGTAGATAAERLVPQEPAEVYRSRRKVCMQVAKPLFYVGIKDAAIPRDPLARMRREAGMHILGEILFSRSGPFFSRVFEQGLLTSSYSFGYSCCDRFAFHTVSGESDAPEEVLRLLHAHLRQVRRQGIDPEDFERCRRVLYADEIRAYDSAEEIAGTLLTFALEETDPFVYPELLADIRCEELTPLLDDMLCEGSWCLSQVCPRAASNQKGVM